MVGTPDLTLLGSEEHIMMFWKSATEYNVWTVRVISDAQQINVFVCLRIQLMNLRWEYFELNLRLIICVRLCAISTRQDLRHRTKTFLQAAPLLREVTVVVLHVLHLV